MKIRAYNLLMNTIERALKSGIRKYDKYSDVAHSDDVFT